MKVKELKELLADFVRQVKGRNHKPLIGKYAVIKGGWDMAGTVSRVNGNEVTLSDARYLSCLGGDLITLALYGFGKPELFYTQCPIMVPPIIPEVTVRGVSVIIPCTEEAEASIKATPTRWGATHD